MSEQFQKLNPKSSTLTVYKDIYKITQTFFSQYNVTAQIEPVQDTLIYPAIVICVCLSTCYPMSCMLLDI